MKTVLLACCLFIAITGYAQTIPKGARAITITTTLSDSAAFEKAVALFNGKGYVVNNANYRTNRIITANNATLGPYTMRILASIRHGVISLKGQSSLQDPGMRHVNRPVVYDANNTVDISKKLFIELSKIAETLKGSIDGATLKYVMASRK